MRRFISVLLALVICFSLACTVSAATVSTPNNAPVDLGNIGSMPQGSNGSMSVTIQGATMSNAKVSVNGAPLGSGDYSISDSGVITLSPSYLSKLGAGKYTMTIEVNGQLYTVTFTISASGVVTFFTNPKTGDMARMDLWVPMMAASALALVAVMFVYFKKFRKVN